MFLAFGDRLTLVIVLVKVPMPPHWESLGRNRKRNRKRCHKFQFQFQAATWIQTWTSTSVRLSFRNEKCSKSDTKKKRRNTLARYSWPEFYFFFGGLVFAWYEFGLGRGRGCGCGLLGCCWAYRSTWPSTWIALECCKYFLRLPARRLETETNLECPPWRQMSSEKLSGDEPSLLWGQRRAFEVLIAACQQVTSHRYLLTMLPRRKPKYFWVGLRFYEKQQISKNSFNRNVCGDRFIQNFISWKHCICFEKYCPSTQLG